MTELPQSARTASAIRLPDGFAAAGEARTASMVGARDEVVTAEKVPLCTVRLALVREAAFPRSIEEVVALGADEDVIRAHAAAVVARVTEDLAARHWAALLGPRPAMRSHVDSSLWSEAPVAVYEQPGPLPAPIRFLHLRPELRRDCHLMGVSLV